ncbi:hypothetical protein ACTA71_001556 [Dictyostelium dimigraforme]
MNYSQEEPSNENTDPNQNNFSFSTTPYKLPPYTTLLNNYNNKLKNQSNNKNKNKNKNNNKNRTVTIKMETIKDILSIDDSDEDLNTSNNSTNNLPNYHKNKKFKTNETTILDAAVASFKEFTISAEETIVTPPHDYPRKMPHQITTGFSVIGGHMIPISQMKRKLDFSGFLKDYIV